MFKKIKKKKKSKYLNEKVKGLDGIKYDSKKEARRGAQLELLQKAGEIKDLRRQVPFVLLESFKDNQGNTERGVKFYADFVYFEGKFQIIEDVKSEITIKKADYIIKRKLFKMTYPEFIFRET